MAANFESFKEYLHSKIPQFHEWGRSSSKPPESLWDEIQGGDSEIIEEEGFPIRLTHPVFIQVLYQNFDSFYRLIEEKQVFKDGRVRVRDLPASLGEKGIVGEDPAEVASRAVQEELKTIPMSLAGAVLSFFKNWQEDTDARSYPGLRTRSNNTMFEYRLPENQGEPVPFTLEEKGRVTFFNWIRELLTNQDQR